MPSEKDREVDIEKAALDEEEERPATGSGPSSSLSSSAGANAKESGAQESSGSAGTAGEITWPDGGLQAWGNILGCTLISLTAFGTFLISLGDFAVGQVANAFSSIRHDSRCVCVSHYLCFWSMRESRNFALVMICFRERPLFVPRHF